MSVVQGGCGFPFLSRAVYEYIACGKHTNVDVEEEDIPDMCLRFAIQKVGNLKVCISMGIIIVHSPVIGC